MSKQVRLRKVERLSQLAVAKLESSGLDEADADALGMYSVDNAVTLSDNFEGNPALVLPYYAADGSPLRAHSAWPDFYRIRYLDEAKGVKGFGDVTGGKRQRYSQPPSTGVCAYLPRLSDWTRIAEDTREPILITEGELKAAKACKEGFPTIGLGGVYNFRQSRMGIFWLPELEAIQWARRRTIIVYDSDYQQKPEICDAINALAEELQERGALVEVATLPDVYEEEDRKTGLDDFLVARGADGLVKVLAESEPLAMTSRLWAMNEEIVYVASPGLVVVQDTLHKMKPSDFTGHSKWSTASVPERIMRRDGTVSYEKTGAASTWLSWPLRQAVDRLTYKPGQGRFVEHNGRRQFNQWPGWGCEPKKGDIKPWLKLCEFIFAGADKGFQDWFLDWCAYPLQYPGTKMFSAVVVHGRATGTGKSLIGYTLGRIYGSNFTKINNKHLHGDFNGWAENRSFVLGDEISGSDKRSESDAMKAVITQEEVSINVKMIPEYTVEDCINYYFTSNHADAFFVEDKDRRYAVHEVIHEDPLPLEFYTEYDAWKAGDGPAALFHWLLQRDLSNFNPKAPPPKTAALQRMILQGKGDLALWCKELAESPESKLRVGQMRHVRDMFTSRELLEMYRKENDDNGKVTANGISRQLAAAGFHMAYGGQPIKLSNGTQGRYFIIRNADRWSKCKTVKELAKNIEQTPVRD